MADEQEAAEAPEMAGDLAGAGQTEVAEQQSQAVLRSSALMAVGTITSRVTGVARDAILAAAIGSAILADTYNLGNSLPNIIYILVVGGALNAIFIPQLIRHMKSDADGGDGYADRLITLTAMILLGLTVIAVLFAPLIVNIYASAAFHTPEHAQDLQLAVMFARFCLPQIIFYGLFTMFSQVLNSRLHFGAPMFAPIVNNIVMIATTLMFIWITHDGVTTSSITPGQTALLGLGTTLGVVAQAAVLVPVMRRAGYKWRPRFDFRGHGLGKAGGLAGWTIGLVLVNQLGFIVIARLATGANLLAESTGGTAQGFALYQRAFLVFMLPHSVITISLVTALMPRMSAAAAGNKLREVAHDVGSGMRLIAALIVPALLFLFAFGPMLGTVFFGYGENKGAPAAYTGLVVSVFALGLLPFSLFYLCLRGWYSVEDTRTPFLVTVLYNVLAVPITIAVYAAAPSEYKVAALASGYVLGYWLALPVTWWLLRRRLGTLETRQTLWTITRVIIAGAGAAAVAAGLTIGGFALVRGESLGAAYSTVKLSILDSIAVLAIGGIVLVVVYAGLAFALRIGELTTIAATIRAKLGR